MTPPEQRLLHGQRALVVGGGRGIGAAIAIALADHGAEVAVLDIEPDRADEVAGRISAKGGTGLGLVADVRDEAQTVAAVASARERLGGLDVLVNVAGGMQAFATWQPIDRWTTEQWNTILAINLDYVFHTCREALPSMVAQGRGSIVNIASISGLFGAPHHGAYGAAKAGLVSLTKTMALEYGRFGVRVNGIAPGTILTPAVAGGRTTSEGSARLASMVPLGRRGKPEDVANVAVFLASPLGGYVSGQTINVDGGASVRFPLMLPGTDISEAPQ